MDSRTLSILLVLAALAGGLFLMNRSSSSLFSATPSDTFISPYDVRGMAVVHLGKPYTLNFDQQNYVVEALNKALPVGRLRANPAIARPFEKLIIYRFNQPDIDLPLVDLADKTLVFQANDWNPQGYLTEVTVGELYNVLTQAYGP